MTDMRTAPAQATIDRAVALLDEADAADLARWLAATSLHAHLKADPAELRRNLTTFDADSAGERFGAWKGAQQLLQAAGLPY